MSAQLFYSLNCHEGDMLSTICSAKQKSIQMCAELRHCQRWVTNRERQRVPQWRTRDGKTSAMWQIHCLNKNAPTLTSCCFDNLGLIFINLSKQHQLIVNN